MQEQNKEVDTVRCEGGIMSKAVLVMDMPESCDVCDFADMVNGEIYCGVPGCGEIVEDYVGCRPDFCPLKHLPDKEKGDEFQDEYSDGYMRGWNACIDAIGGDQP